MSTVWIPAIPTRFDPLSKQRVAIIDLSPATEYGTLRQIIESDLDVDRNVNAAVDRVVDAIHDDYKPDDYILAVGDLVVCAAAVATALAREGSANVLRWSKHMREYSVVEVTL